MTAKPLRISLILFEKIVAIIGTTLIFVANILFFVRNGDIIDQDWLWISITCLILLFIIFFNIKDLALAFKNAENKRVIPVFFIMFNTASCIFLYFSFQEMVLTEYYAPVGGHEDVFYALLCGSLCLIFKFLADSVKLFCCNSKLRFIKEFYVLVFAFFLVHAVLIIRQPDFHFIPFKNRISVASLAIPKLSPADEFLGHKAYPLGTTNSPYGYLIYEPGTKNTPGEVPLLIFLHGGDETGDSRKDNKILKLVAKHGPSRYIKNGVWNPPSPVIVVSPQTTDGWWRPEMVHEFIEFLIENYAIDESRIYLTGLSRGGTGSFDYINTYGDSSYVAAMLPLATDAIQVNSGKFTPENFKNTPVWLFINNNDKYVADYRATTEKIKTINKINNQSKVTVYPRQGHDSWTYTYTLKGQGLEMSEFDPFDMNIWDWLFQHKKDRNE